VSPLAGTTKSCVWPKGLKPAQLVADSTKHNPRLSGYEARAEKKNVSY